MFVFTVWQGENNRVFPVNVCVFFLGRQNVQSPAKKKSWEASAFLAGLMDVLVSVCHTWEDKPLLEGLKML